MARDIEDENLTGTPVEVRFCNFPTGKAGTLASHDDWVVRQLKPRIKDLANAWVDVIGFASKLGFKSAADQADSDRKNKALSDQRCEEVKKVIRKHIPNLRVNLTDGRGTAESTGPAQNDDGYWRAVKLRVFGAAAPGPIDPPAKLFVCGPDVTEMAAKTWERVQTDFRSWTITQQVQACVKLLIPLRKPDLKDLGGLPTNMEELKQMARQFADINVFDTLPLFQGDSAWLRRPPVFDRATGGPCATPSSTNPDAKTPDGNPDAYDDGHEDPDTCSNSVQVGNQCWLAGTVNYGLFGVGVRLCSDMARHPLFQLNPLVPAKLKLLAASVFSLDWAVTLIRAYKKFGHHPEQAELPIAWTKATFHKGPRGTPAVPGNRPKCQCGCKCRADVVPWDYVWEPIKIRDKATHP